MPQFRVALAVIVSFLGLQVIGLLAQDGKSTAKKGRARLPVFTPADVDKVFFADVFSALVGERPANLSSGGATGTGGTTTAEVEKAATGTWAAYISATTIEDEVKAIKLIVDKDVTTPSEFKGRGYREVRQHFSVLAMLFGVINEYDGDVRWKKDAVAGRDAFGRTAANAKVGTTQVYNEAKLRKQELQDLVGGGSLPAGKGEVENNWAQIAERSPLMQRLEVAQMTNLQPMLASEGEFKKNMDRIFHEAEILAAISHAMTLEGMEDADDDEYKAFSEKMRQAGVDIKDAVKLKNYEKASKAAAAMTQSCDECHESYRG
ncbi:MAG: hypothetical protein QGG36_15120 [Pirellulaceae bacterium]|jgi:hypothetical protein|nr:hypothetical protein [Pirellulaceae bacterium]MDP7017136.1 hypothetical protein [Pirellulaceae bacterium]